MKILALDLGTHMGVAHNLSGTLEAATVTLATPKEITAWRKQRLDRRGDPRIYRMMDFLSKVPVPDLVVAEDVTFQTYTFQTQLWSSFRTVVWLAFRDKCKIDFVPVSTLKKFATGHGGADKKMMEAALFKLHPEWVNAKLGDDAVDALWLFYWTEKNLSRMPIAAKKYFGDYAKLNF